MLWWGEGVVCNLNVNCWFSLLRRAEVHSEGSFAQVFLARWVYFGAQAPFVASRDFFTRCLRWAFLHGSHFCQILLYISLKYAWYSVLELQCKSPSPSLRCLHSLSWRRVHWGPNDPSTCLFQALGPAGRIGSQGVRDGGTAHQHRVLKSLGYNGLGIRHVLENPCTTKHGLAPPSVLCCKSACNRAVRCCSICARSWLCNKRSCCARIFNNVS